MAEFGRDGRLRQIAVELVADCGGTCNRLWWRQVESRWRVCKVSRRCPMTQPLHSTSCISCVNCCSYFTSTPSPITSITAVHTCKALLYIDYMTTKSRLNQTKKIPSA